VVRVCPKGRRQNQNGGRQKGKNNDDPGKTDPFAVSMSRCDGLNVGMLFMSLKKPVEIRVTVAPVSISKFVITPFTKGHVVRFCPKGRRQNQNGGRQKGRNNDDQGKTDTTPVTSDKTPGSVGVHKLAPEAGMFIKAKVNGVITNLLIDTGATVTLISTGFIKDMSNMPTLSPSQRDILTANGESLKVAGKTIIEIQSDNFKCLNEAVVADINVDGILGLEQIF
jgi:predicted aspartyl protease